MNNVYNPIFAQRFVRAIAPRRLPIAALLVLTSILLFSGVSLAQAFAVIGQLSQSAVAASWAQALGTVAAVFAAIWIASDQHRQNRKGAEDALRADRYAAIALTIHVGSLLRGHVIALRRPDSFMEAALTASAALAVADRHLAAHPPHMLRDRFGLEHYAQVPGILLVARRTVELLEAAVQRCALEERAGAAAFAADVLEGLAEKIETKASFLGGLYHFRGVDEHIHAVGKGRYEKPLDPVQTPDLPNEPCAANA